MSSLSSIYTERINYYQAQIRAVQKRLNLVSLLRLLAFVILAASIYFCVSNFKPIVLLAAIIFFLLFAVLVWIHLSLKEKKQLQEQLLFVNGNELAVLQQLPNKFENGQSFQTQESYIGDLDIFGPGSVFHLLNRATTIHGREKLAGSLMQPFYNKEEIESWQLAVQIFSEEFEKRQLLIAGGLVHEEKEGNLNSIGEWLNTENVLHQKEWISVVRWVLPVFNIIVTYLFLAEGKFIPFFMGLVLTWGIIGSFSKYISAQHLLISKKETILDQYTSVLRVFSTVTTGSSKRMQQLHNEALQAHHSIRDLSKLSRLFDQRLNMLVFFFLNFLFLYDIHIMVALEDWKKNNQKRFAEWVDCVGSIEYLNSLATFAFNNSDYVYPLVTEDKLCIEAKEAAHPLIAKQERVGNDFSIGKNENVQLITGSNMSGKTTFLRTVGVNLLLAQCGAPVCAKSFVFSPMALLSSIRVSDSLQEHTSYFMAELKRLQQIIRQLQSGAPALVLIDEILRGTNSEDKTYGSEQFIKKLLQYNCVALFATHDLNLSKLENEFPLMIANYCFESRIQHDQLDFDYRLMKGVAKNKNASFLMKQMEII